MGGGCLGSTPRQMGGARSQKVGPLPCLPKPLNIKSPPALAPEHSLGTRDFFVSTAQLQPQQENVEVRCTVIRAMQEVLLSR